VADDLPGLISLVQMDVLELHTWNSLADDVEVPNRIVIDLDPGPEIEWQVMVAGARRVRGVLAAIGLPAYVKTTGGAGLHVVAPLAPRHEWRECFALARAIADVLVHDDPQTFTTTLTKAGRTDKILLDYLRNNRTNTSIAAYSTRAHGRGTISVPITWDELGSVGASGRYDVRNLRQRLSRLRSDPWQGSWHSQTRIPAGALEALRRLVS
jgi:bifunctional non-homologous end joining protein LigD